MTKTPKAVLISDIHYNINTLAKADAALNMAADTAIDLDVPLIIAGDLHDTKAMLRGECVKAIMKTLGRYSTNTIVMPGNHCMISEKSNEHSLEFLKPICFVYDFYKYVSRYGLHIIPYQTDSTKMQQILAKISKGSTIVTHTGVQTAKMGHYVQDKTSLPPEAFDGYRVISGHYHARQDIKCGETGLFSYIGNPYTLSFGEANDPPKGFQVLYSDGSLEFVPTNLQKHIVAERDVSDIYPPIENYSPGDLVWLKVTGPYMELEKLNKQEIGQKLLGHSNFKFTKIPTDSKPVTIEIEKFTDGEILDKLIDNTDEHVEEKDYLKNLWREVME